MLEEGLSTERCCRKVNLEAMIKRSMLRERETKAAFIILLEEMGKVQYSFCALGNVVCKDKVGVRVTTLQKRLAIFLFPAGMSLTKLSLARNN